MGAEEKVWVPTEEAVTGMAAVGGGPFGILMTFTVMQAVWPKLETVWSSVVNFWLRSSQTKTRD